MDVEEREILDRMEEEPVKTTTRLGLHHISIRWKRPSSLYGALKYA